MSNPFAPKTEEEYQVKLDALASAITRMDPDVLAVQEVGDPVARIGVGRDVRDLDLGVAGEQPQQLGTRIP